MFYKCFKLVTCKIKHYNFFANVLQMFYFTCNHGLRPRKMLLDWLMKDENKTD